MTIGTYLFTWFCGKPVGKDEFGNQYFVSKKPSANGKPKRWVVYKNKAESSGVPATWHGWLHYITDTLPEDTAFPDYAWLAPHKQNFTGTKLAYFPSGHVLKGGQRDKATGDYQPWQP